jgi:hypothetical protein
MFPNRSGTERLQVDAEVRTPAVPRPSRSTAMPTLPRPGQSTAMPAVAPGSQSTAMPCSPTSVTSPPEPA